MWVESTKHRIRSYLYSKCKFLTISLCHVNAPYERTIAARYLHPLNVKLSITFRHTALDILLSSNDQPTALPSPTILMSTHPLRPKPRHTLHTPRILHRPAMTTLPTRRHATASAQFRLLILPLLQSYFLVVWARVAFALVLRGRVR